MPMARTVFDMVFDFHVMKPTTNPINNPIEDAKKVIHKVVMAPEKNAGQYLMSRSNTLFGWRFSSAK